MKVRTVKTINYWEDRRGKKFLAATQRVASAAMAEALGAAKGNDVKRTNPRKVARFLKTQPDYPVVIWIREPLDRLACAYHIWNENKTGMTPEEFAKWAMGSKDPHLAPQALLHSPGGVFLPSRVYAYEHLAETWPLEFGKYPLRRIGHQKLRMSTEDFIRQLSAEVKSDLEDHYLDDQLIHQIALDNPGCRVHGLNGRAA